MLKDLIDKAKGLVPKKDGPENTEPDIGSGTGVHTSIREDRDDLPDTTLSKIKSFTNSALLGDIVSKIKNIGKKNVPQNDRNNDDEDDEESAVVDTKSEAEKKRSMIIKVVAAAGIAYLAYDQFFGVPDEQAESNVKQPTVKIAKKKIPVEEGTPVGEPTPSNIQTPPPETSQDGIADTKPPSFDEPTNKPLEEVPTPAFEQPMAEVTPVPELPSEPIIPPSGGELTVNDNKTEVQEPGSLNIEDELNTTQEVVPTPTTLPKEPDEEISKIVNQVDAENKLQVDAGVSAKPKTLAPLPNYERIGRGLVYNCTDRHWACVDKENYFKCVRNQKANEAGGASTECYAADVYLSDEDCKVMQTHNVNTITTVTFCRK